MQARTFLFRILHASLLIGFINGVVLAQNPGDPCDPDQSMGHMARIGSVSGTVLVMNAEGIQLRTAPGMALPQGSTIQTGVGSGAVLIIEDGTRERQSRLLLNENSEAVLKGGLYCSDLRPKADGGRWSSREVEIELPTGSMRFEIAEPVSYSFNATIRTYNTVATMQRNRHEQVVIEVASGDIGDRTLVPVMEHLVIQSHISGLLLGQNLNDLSESDRRAVQKHAVITAISLGYVDLETEGYLDHPQAGQMVQMMSRGRNFDELEQQEKEMIAQVVGAILVDSGHINPDEVMIHNEPDERSVFHVHNGRFRLYNSRLGFRRDRVIMSEAGTVFEVRGYDMPVPVL